MNLYAILAGVVLYCSSIAGAYVYGRHDGRQIEIAAQAQIKAVATRIRDEIATRTAEQIAGIEIKHVTIHQQLETEIREKPVYRDCRNTPDGMQLINAALTGSEPRTDHGELPAAPTADGR